MNQDDKIANMTFADIYPHYLQKIEKKWRTQWELERVISWLTWYNDLEIDKCIEDNLNFTDFFNWAKLNPHAKLISWSICGVKIQDIENPITQQVRYLDKLVDELAKWKNLDKIFRKK